MFRFIVRRLLVTVPMVLVVITLTWALIRLAPGNFYATERKLPPTIEKNIRAKYGLDKPWYVQYGRMMSNIIRLDFGNSLKYENETVNDILLRTLPVSATIGILAYLIALAVGIFFGTLAALKPNSKLDYISMALAMLGLGNYFINANLNRDEPLIIGIVAFVSIAVLIFNLAVDIAYAFIDPRIRY